MLLLRLLTRRGLLPGAREEGLRLRHHGDDGLLDLRVDRDGLRGLLQADDDAAQGLRRQHGLLAAEVLLLEGALAGVGQHGEAPRHKIDKVALVDCIKSK